MQKSDEPQRKASGPLLAVLLILFVAGFFCGGWFWVYHFQFALKMTVLNGGVSAVLFAFAAYIKSARQRRVHVQDARPEGDVDSMNLLDCPYWLGLYRFVLFGDTRRDFLPALEELKVDYAQALGDTRYDTRIA